MKTVALYERVSDGEQTIALQERELVEACERHGWQIVARFVDQGISGSKGRDQRPQFDALCKAITRHQFDIVAAWSVDRLGRSLQHLVAFLGEIQASGVNLYLHKQGLDTSTPAGRAMFGMLGVFGEFERAMIVERVRSGMAKARSQGTRTGRPIGRPALDQATQAAIHEALAGGASCYAVAKVLKLDPHTVAKYAACLPLRFNT